MTPGLPQRRFRRSATSPVERDPNSAVAERSHAIRPGMLDGLAGRSDLTVMSLEHLLLHSMLQHPNNTWAWGIYVVVRPADNPRIADVCARYGERLADSSIVHGHFARTTARRWSASTAHNDGRARAIAAGLNPRPTPRRAIHHTARVTPTALANQSGRRLTGCRLTRARFDDSGGVQDYGANFSGVNVSGRPKRATHPEPKVVISAIRSVSTRRTSSL